MLLFHAVKTKLTEQRKFVVWWDSEGLRKGGGAPLQVRKGGTAGKKGIPDSITLHRWRTRLKDESRFAAYGEKYAQAVNERQADTWRPYAWDATRVGISNRL